MGVDIVHVWLVDTDLPANRWDALAALLDRSERRRAAALREPVDARRFVAAHGAVRTIVGDWLGAPPAALRWAYGPHGKPALADGGGALEVNLSHSGPLAMVALTAHRPVGVDIQRVPRGHIQATRLGARYFPVAEARYVSAARGRAAQAHRFARLWARKEACVKAGGGRLLPGLALPVHVSGSRAPVPVPDPTGEESRGFLVRDVPAPREFRAAVALAGTAAYRVVRHRWPG